MSRPTRPSDSELEAFMQTLTPDEVRYAHAFADHLALADVRPEEPVELDSDRCGTIRVAVSRAWARHVWGASR